MLARRPRLGRVPRGVGERALMAAVALLIGTPLALAQTCALVPANTLSTACSGACSPEQLCMASISPSTKCVCYSATTNGTVSFLIAFNTSTTARLRTNPPEKVTDIFSGGDDTATFGSVTNDLLTKIDQWTLPSATTAVVLRGGSNMTALHKGFVADVEIAASFLDNQTQVSSLSLVSIGLGASANSIVTNLPSSLLSLTLSNALLTEFPASIAKLPLLREAYLAWNNITEVTSSHTMNALTDLDLRSNRISSFTAVYPSLRYLNLEYNNLTSVPAVIPALPNLQQLYLAGNAIPSFAQENTVEGLRKLLANPSLPSLSSCYSCSGDYDSGLHSCNLIIFDAYMPDLELLHLDRNPLLTDVSFTLEQAKFLDKLADFTIDSTRLQSVCESSQQLELKKFGYTVCISAAPATTNQPALTSDASEHSTSNSTLIIGCAAGGVVLVGLAVAFLTYHTRKKKKKSKPNEDSLATPPVQSSINRGRQHGVSLWNDQHLQAVRVSVDDIQDIKKIGSGAFADVWLVELRKTTLLASKRLRESDITRERTQAFIDEVKLVSALKHHNIVMFMGVAWVRAIDLQALFEFMDNGDLRTYLMNPRVPTQWSADKLQIAIDVAEALVYVHSFLPPLVHRDLKSRNVLLNSEMCAKLTDFGVSRYHSDQNTMTVGVGTSRWLAPEVISGDGSYGTAADMFSFGVLLSELDNHQIPYANVRGSNGNRLVEVALLQMISTGQLKPRMSTDCPKIVSALANRCFALSPAARPQATEVAYLLRECKNSQASFYV